MWLHHLFFPLVINSFTSLLLLSHQLIYPPSTKALFSASATLVSRACYSCMTVPPVIETIFTGRVGATKIQYLHPKNDIQDGETSKSHSATFSVCKVSSHFFFFLHYCLCPKKLGVVIILNITLN